jgi:membrane glycosyltransferase
MPLIGGLLLAVPLTVLTASPALGLAARRRRICGIPEEYDAPAEVAVLAAPTARAA